MFDKKHSTSSSDATATDEQVAIERRSTSPTSVREAQERFETAKHHASEKRLGAAMDALLLVLDAYPKHKEALELAALILSMASSRSATERLRPSVFAEPLLDSLFNQCGQCHKAWPYNPLYRQAAQITVTNAVGGRCPRCSLVWCRECAGGGVFLSCPSCRESLEILKEPNGRRRGLGKPKHPELKLVLASVFKLPPEPRNQTSYLNIVLDALLPDAFHAEGANIRFHVGEVTEEGARMQTLARAMLLKLPVHAEHTYIESFTDADGGRGFVVALYRPR